MGILGDHGFAFGQHRAPFGGRRLHAQTDVGKRSRLQDGVADAHRHRYDDRGDGVGQDVAHDDAEFGAVDFFRRLNVLLLAHRQNGTAEQAHRHRDAADGKGQNGVSDAGAQSCRYGDGKQHAGDCLDDVQDTHHDVIHFAAVIAHQGAQQYTDDGGNQGGHQAQPQGSTGTVHDAGEDIAAHAVAAEQMLPGWQGIAVSLAGLGVIVRSDPGRKEGDRDQHNHDAQADHGYLVFAEPVHDLAELTLPLAPYTRMIFADSCYRHYFFPFLPSYWALMRGSTKAYTISTSSMIRLKIRPRISTPPITTG